MQFGAYDGFQVTEYCFPEICCVPFFGRQKGPVSVVAEVQYNDEGRSVGRDTAMGVVVVVYVVVTNEEREDTKVGSVTIDSPAPSAFVVVGVVDVALPIELPLWALALFAAEPLDCANTQETSKRRGSMSGNSI